MKKSYQELDTTEVRSSNNHRQQVHKELEVLLMPFIIYSRNYLTEDVKLIH